MQWTERQPKKGSNTWNTNSVIFVQYFTFSAVKQLNKYPRPRYILLGTPQPNYSGSELGNQSFVYFTFCCISVELLRRRRINCVYISAVVCFLPLDGSRPSVNLLLEITASDLDNCTFLLVNRIQSTNQISLEGLLLTVSVIPNDLWQSTTIKHGSRSRIIQLQILIEIKKKK